MRALADWLAHVVDLITDSTPLAAGLIGTLVGLGLPLYMYPLALVGERRRLRYADQLRGFMPGDLFLGVAFGMACYLAAASHRGSGGNFLCRGSLWWLPVGAGLLVIVGRGIVDVTGAVTYKPGDVGKYHWRQLVSPTALWHNTVVYGAYGYLWTAIGVVGIAKSPSYVSEVVRATFDHLPLTLVNEANAVNDIVKIVLVVALGFWVGNLAIDFTSTEAKRKFQTAHQAVGFCQTIVGLSLIAATLFATYVFVP